MALSEHWLTHITTWQSSGLSQAVYLAKRENEHQRLKGTTSNIIMTSWRIDMMDSL